MPILIDKVTESVTRSIRQVKYIEDFFPKPVFFFTNNVSVILNQSDTFSESCWISEGGNEGPWFYYSIAVYLCVTVFWYSPII